MQYRFKRHSDTTDTTDTTNITDTDPSPGSGGAQSTPILDPLPCQFKGQSPANKTDEAIRQQVVQAVLEQGLTLTAAAEKFCLSRDTVSAIVKGHRQEVGELENVRLGNKFHKLAERVVDELSDRDLSATPVSQLGVLAGISIDKKLQLTGKPAGGNGNISMRVAWKDGSGAVEVTTGGGSGSGTQD